MVAAAHHHARSQPHRVSQPGRHHFPQFGEELSPPYANVSGSGAYTAGDQFETPPAKRQRVAVGRPPAGTDGQKGNPSTVAAGPASAAAAPVPAGDLVSMSGATAGDKSAAAPNAPPAGGGPPPAGAATVVTKSKRVRTGCLTCRERHLKCDEAVPDCVNCRKSNRECKRGVRLNFIDVQVKSPPYVPPTTEWSVQFQDESRLIASEYRGGLGRYARFDQRTITPPRETELEASLRQQPQTEASISAGPPGAGNNGMPVQAARGMYFSGLSRQLQTEHGGYGDGTMDHLRDVNPRPECEPFLAMPSSQQTPPSAAPGTTFSLTSLQSHLAIKEDLVPRAHAHRTSDGSSASSSLIPHSAGPGTGGFPAGPLAGQAYHPDGLMTPPSERALGGEIEYLSSEDEILFMQVFVKEVGVWMDSLDHKKHFSRIIPYLALKSPMLLNAFLACGVKHLTLIDPNYKDDKALYYYDTATTQLLRSLQNPDRNMAECATTAVVLNVYEIMSEKPTQRMSHIAGARALIRECGWNAKSTGIGGACFWLNIGMEVLSCLAFNWQTAWDPDQWGIDLEFTNLQNPNQLGGGCGDDGIAGYGGAGSSSSSLGGGGEDEMWVHRIFYIVAKIANFRAGIPRFQEPSPHDEQVRLQSRYAEWKRLKGLCDWWNSSSPRPMRPFGHARQASQSLFPNVWLIKRAAIVGRLFYHTAMCLLAQINPLSPRDSEDNVVAQQHHAHQVCGIVAHTKDPGVSSVAIRSMAIASSVLTDPREQEEVLQILERIYKDTGWRLGKVIVELKKTWGWEKPPVPGPLAGAAGQPPAGGSSMPPQFFATSQPPPQPLATASSAAPVSAPAPMRPLVNPLLVQADFSLPNHPYQNWYEPPNRANSFNSHAFWPG